MAETIEQRRARKARQTREWGDRNPERVLYKTRQTQARLRGLEWSLSFSSFMERLKPMTCEVSGLPLSWECGKHGAWRPSIDRIDPLQGYTGDNVRIVCWLYNRAKHIGTDEEVMRLAIALVEGVDGGI